MAGYYDRADRRALDRNCLVAHGEIEARIPRAGTRISLTTVFGRGSQTLTSVAGVGLGGARKTSRPPEANRF